MGPVDATILDGKKPTTTGRPSRRPSTRPSGPSIVEPGTGRPAKPAPRPVAVKPRPVKVKEKVPEKMKDAMDDVLAGIDFGDDEEEEPIEEVDPFLKADGSLDFKKVDFGLISRM